MCGRITQRAPLPALQEEFSFTRITPVVKLEPRYNLPPSERVLVIANETPERILDAYRWGLVPRFAKDEKTAYRMINARAETLLERPSFRGALVYRRCLVVADGFYEWQRDGRGRKVGKTPWFIHKKGDRPLAFAGLWDEWHSPAGELLRSCAIITTTSSPLVAKLHDRMPVILPRAAYATWLDPKPVSPAAVLPLLVPYAGTDLEAWPVSAAVNSTKHDAPDCVKRVPDVP
jgi:putative SOS response-associated peptidase YedK